MVDKNLYWILNFLVTVLNFTEPTEEDLEIYRRFVAWDEVAKPRGPIKGLNRYIHTIFSYQKY